MTEHNAHTGNSQTTAKTPHITPFEMAALAANVAEEKKSAETEVIETGQVSTLADYFVVCTAESAVQVRSIYDAIGKSLETLGLKPIGQERDQSGRWFLLDYGDMVVHVMHRQAREFYQLESFWNHARVVDRTQWLTPSLQVS